MRTRKTRLEINLTFEVEFLNENKEVDYKEEDFFTEAEFEITHMNATWDCPEDTDIRLADFDYNEDFSEKKITKSQVEWALRDFIEFNSEKILEN